MTHTKVNGMAAQDSGAALSVSNPPEAAPSSGEGEQ